VVLVNIHFIYLPGLFVTGLTNQGTPPGLGHKVEREDALKRGGWEDTCRRKLGYRMKECRMRIGRGG
jgi:hypothetical protein